MPQVYVEDYLDNLQFYDELDIETCVEAAQALTDAGYFLPNRLGCRLMAEGYDLDTLERL